MGIEENLPSGVLLTPVEKLVNWTRKASFWPATFGLACCAIEMMASGGARYDLARFRMEVFRAPPPQAHPLGVRRRAGQEKGPRGGHYPRGPPRGGPRKPRTATSTGAPG